MLTLSLYKYSLNYLFSTLQTMNNFVIYYNNGRQKNIRLHCQQCWQYLKLFLQKLYNVAYKTRLLAACQRLIVITDNTSAPIQYLCDMLRRYYIEISIFAI